VKHRGWSFAVVVAAWLGVPAVARAQESCGTHVTRSNVVSCALARSFAIEAERAGTAAAEGRRLAASPVLPSNPVLSATAGRRQDPLAGETGAAWDVSVSQELEIAGQRGLRREAAEADVAAQRARVAQTERDVATDALDAYFEVLAAREESALAGQLVAIGTRVATVARAKAAGGLVAPVDADVADAELAGLAQEKLAADRRLRTARAALASQLGLDAVPEAWTVEGELAPLDAPELRGALATPRERPEVQALEAERRAHALRADAFRRSRIPNPTVSVFGQNYERSLGAGIAIPIPVPGLGRTYDGEIAEAEALSRRAKAEADHARRTARRDVQLATVAVEARVAELAAFPEDLVKRAESSLESMASEVESGRLAVRDAMVAQRSLVDLLRKRVAARHALCAASVELARAVGAPLEGGAR
jgi:cobalt-zinc-cadmium efflux system outer membrane protein